MELIIMIQMMYAMQLNEICDMMDNGEDTEFEVCALATAIGVNDTFNEYSYDEIESAVASAIIDWRD